MGALIKGVLLLPLRGDDISPFPALSGFMQGPMASITALREKIDCHFFLFPSKVPGQALKHIRLEVHENALAPALSLFLPALTLLHLIVHSDKQKVDNLEVLQSCQVW